MRTLRITAAGLSLMLGLCTVASADPPDSSAKPASGFTQFWPPNWFATKPAPKAEEHPPTARVDERAQAAAATRFLREHEEKAYLRRQAVCDKLQAIAESTGDESLRRKAEVLADRAFTLYLQRTSGEATVRPRTGQANLRRDN